MCFYFSAHKNCNTSYASNWSGRLYQRLFVFSLIKIEMSGHLYQQLFKTVVYTCFRFFAYKKLSYKGDYTRRRAFLSMIRSVIHMYFRFFIYKNCNTSYVSSWAGWFYIHIFVFLLIKLIMSGHLC